MRAPEGGFLAGGRGRDHTWAMNDVRTAGFTVNGEVRRLAGPMTVAGLLAELGLDGRKVAVERNEAIVPRSAYAITQLEAGDSLEIVHFIGGG